MYRGHTVGVVIPAYNEEGFVGDVIDTVPSFVDRIYAVDDASTDGTWDEIRRHADRKNAIAREDRDESPPSGVDVDRGRSAAGFDRPVVPIQHDRNRGAGGAIKTGYQRALAEGVDVTALMDGDGQMDPDVLDRLLDPLVEGRADYVKGNRLLATTDRGDMPRLRFVGNATLGALTKIASGYWRTGDPQTGYTAISKEALAAIDLDEMFEFYGYCNDLLVKLNVAEMRVVDVPIPINYGDEESHIRFRTYVPKVSWMLLRNLVWRLRVKYLVFGFHPLVAVYVVGALATALGGAGLLATAGAAGTGASTGASALTAGGVSALLGTVGVLALAWAMVLDRDANAGMDWQQVPRTGGAARAPEWSRDPRPVARAVDGGREPTPPDGANAPDDAAPSE